MKRFFTKRMVAFVCAAVMLAGFLSLPLLSKKKTAHADTEPFFVDSEIWMEHKTFQQVNGGDRRSFLQNSYDYEAGTGTKLGEQIAAEYIVNRLTEFGYRTEVLPNDDGTDGSGGTGGGTAMSLLTTPTTDSDTDNKITPQIILQPFSQVFTESQTSIWTQPAQHTLWSQNVILRFDNAETDKRVIIGANMDNDYDEGKSEGALAGGSGVAILLAMAKCLKIDVGGQEINLSRIPYDLDIVFFGAGLYNGDAHYIGSENYCQKNSFGKILLMANVGRIGGETTYVYSDEVQTKLQDYAVQTGRGFKPLPKSLPQISPTSGTPDNFSYAHFGMVGNHSKFMQRGIPVLNLFCGDYGGITLMDKEGSGDILAKDTVENMRAAYPDAYQKMSDVLTALLDMTTDNGLESVITDSQAGKFDYSMLMQEWIAYLILGAIILISFVVLLHISRRLLAKYPPAGRHARPKSVFGDDYENKPPRA